MKKFIFALLITSSAFASAEPKKDIEFNDKVSSHLSVHVLDTISGRSAANVPVELYRQESDTSWKKLVSTKTKSNGHVYLLDKAADNKGTYRLYVNTAITNPKSLFPFVNIVFDMNDSTHYHIPLRLSGNSYTTYRGN